MATMDQKAAFADRLNRINSGRQYEHEDIVGFRTQKLYKKKHGDKAKRPRRTFLDYVMILVAFLSGVVAVLIGRLAYFHLARIEGLPEAFYDLGARGMALFALVLAVLLALTFHLSTRARIQALAVGCVVMHFGEAAVAANAPDFWAEIFSPDYAAAIAEQGAGYQLSVHS